ncbi:MAG: uroporphyrinogen decarboxylase family protein [Chloroflexota bacterium]
MGTPLTSRDRVLTALDHREPDRVPFDLGGTFVTSAHHVAYRRIRGALGLDPDATQVADIRLGLAWVDREVRDRLGADVGIVATQPPDPSSWQLEVRDAGRYWELTDEYGMLWRQPKDGGLYFDLAGSPLAGDITPADVRRYPWPDPADPHRFTNLRADCERVVLEEGRASACKGIIAGTLETSLWMRGFEQFFMDLIEEPALAGAILDRVLEVKLRFWEQVLGRIGDLLDVVYDADDYGGQEAPLIAPDLWRRMVKPRIAELYRYIHEHSRAKVFLHSDGAIRELIPDLIEAGVDALNPVQFTAAGMDLASLKTEFGRELCFWGGGVDTQGVLPRGTPQQVRDQVRRCVETLMPGGGYVFATVHNTQADVPPENFLAMWEAFREAGVYA